MALISAKTILTSLSLFHLTLGFFFLTNPATVADQTIVYVLGEAMGMPYSRSFDSPSPSLAFLAVVLACLGITDMVTLSLPEEICLMHYWGTQAPLRLTLSMSLLFYSYFFSSSSPFYGGTSPSSRGNLYAAAASGTSSVAGGEGLKNRVFFAFAFIETMTWFWIWVTLREEQAQLQSRKARRRSHQL